MILALVLAVASPASADRLLADMQRVEAGRNAAIKAGDMAALRKLYAPGFHGIAASGARVDRDTLLGVFKRNAGGDFIADSTILSARRVNGVVFAEGRLKLTTADRTRIISDSFYLHIYRRRAGRWEMIEGASTPIAQAGH
ncbi:nuclear transport factor 2 family protein [Sphingomonas sp.]|uniref:nuclear transport factor 2 family protein n=1 Tax=Sphingomonas sp. TaxID=28214 RepID=UPI00389B7A06